VPKDLESRRRAIARAFRASARPNDVATLHEQVATLTGRVDLLANELAAMRRGDVLPPMSGTDDDEEPPAGRVSVPPLMPAKISTRVFDVLLGGAMPERSVNSQLA
jgi:hypothetical protein